LGKQRTQQISSIEQRNAARHFDARPLDLRPLTSLHRSLRLNAELQTLAARAVPLRHGCMGICDEERAALVKLHGAR
jgi:hypothetical protein